MQLTDSQLLPFSHSSGDSIQNLLPLLYRVPHSISVPLLPIPSFACRTPDHFLLYVLSSAVSLLTLPTCKHDQNVNHKRPQFHVPFKESRSSPSSHDSFKYCRTSSNAQPTCLTHLPPLFPLSYVCDLPIHSNLTFGSRCFNKYTLAHIPYKIPLLQIQ